MTDASRTAFHRLLAPRSLALIGGAWADAVAAASRAIGYTGQIWRVHPTRESTAQTHYYRSVDELPEAPDAAFIAAPNRDVPQIAAALRRRDAGGFVCFAAGFSEAATQTGEQLTRELMALSGDLPYFGPNCYGFLNFFDGAALWPDQVVGQRQEKAVALICQSGTIALDLLFNDRSLPIGYVFTVGNQTCLAVEDLIERLADDPRISAFGLYVEGLKDATRFAAAVRRAREAGKPIAMVKAGRTDAAARTARTHTGSLAGSDSVFDAFCAQAGLARCDSLATLCETLKVFHNGGPLQGRRILVMGASGGDMAMTADAARDLQLEFPAFEPDVITRLREILTDRVHIANPFDFHTHIWFDRPALHELFREVQRAGFDAVGLMVDCPPAREANPASYVAVIDEFVTAAPGAATRATVISSLPESLPAVMREQCLKAGVIPLQGQRQALEALDLAARVGEAWRHPRSLELIRARHTHTDSGSDPSITQNARMLTEADSKQAVAAFGVRIPKSLVVHPDDVLSAIDTIGPPIVMKAQADTLAHKSEAGAVILDVRSREQARAAAAQLSRLSQQVLIEQMVTGGVAEILVGLKMDPQFGLVLVIGAGGVLAELLRDTVTLLPPFDAHSIQGGLARLAVRKLLTGYRGRPAGDVPALIQTVLACARYAQSNRDVLLELDLNPVIVLPEGQGAVAVDALIRLRQEQEY